MFKNLLLLLFPALIIGQLEKDKLRALQVHNDARKEVGVAPLVWSEKLEQQALKYAKQIARTNNYEHSNTKDGENLAMFYEYEESNKLKTYIYSDTPLYDASKAWYEEIKDYKYSKIKRFRIGPKIGHYTQMVWKDTKEVGIASAISKNGKVYVVARYYPAG
ncbi:MAG: CAP family protein, partial [Bacteroidota bacterium]|nr:CAP family protein [Bacteroidota bacterium]